MAAILAPAAHAAEATATVAAAAPPADASAAAAAAATAAATAAAAVVVAASATTAAAATATTALGHPCRGVFEFVLALFEGFGALHGLVDYFSIRALSLLGVGDDLEGAVGDGDVANARGRLLVNTRANRGEFTPQRKRKQLAESKQAHLRHDTA